MDYTEYLRGLPVVKLGIEYVQKKSILSFSEKWSCEEYTFDEFSHIFSEVSFKKAEIELIEFVTREKKDIIEEELGRK